MSELMKHAPEPGSVSALGNGIHAGDISICQFYNRFGTDFPNFEANARRIVACVNACEGLSTERLEKFLGAAANKAVIRLTTDNLDLKAHIAELWQKLDDSLDSDSAAHIRIAELERQNKILELKNATTLANNLCPDHRDKQLGKPCLACTIETLERQQAVLVDALKHYELGGSNYSAIARKALATVKPAASMSAAAKLLGIELSAGQEGGE